MTLSSTERPQAATSEPPTGPTRRTERAQRTPAGTATGGARRVARSDWPLYLGGAGLTLVVTAYMLRIWGAVWTAPFFYTGDAVGSGAHVKATLEWGWYEYQPDLGAPYGQHYNDYPFSDNLHLALMKVIGPLTGSWPVAFNLYYVLGFVAAGVAMMWFLRVVGVNRLFTPVLGVLYAVAPYHFSRNESHYFLAAYWTIPLALVVVWWALRGEPLWAGRADRPPLLRYLFSRATAVGVIMLVVGFATAYYAVFCGLLLAFAGLVAFARSRSWRRLLGVVVAGGLLLTAFAINLLPDLLYARANGTNTGALVRTPDGGETWSFKLTSLLLPAEGHPITAWGAFRDSYDGTHPLPSEKPALGLICAVVLLIVLGFAFMRIAQAGRPPVPGRTPPDPAVSDLTVLTIFTFLLGTVGGLGAVLSFATDAIRGWNRLSIVLSAYLLAVLGLLLPRGLARLRARIARRGARPTVLVALAPVVAVLLLAVGVWDQQDQNSIPPYASSSGMWASDDAFVRQIEATVPPGSMLFQLPYMGFPENGPLNSAGDSDVLKLSLHSTTLRWSLGGIKGRPQSDWGWTLLKKPPAQVVDTITTMGFTAIVVDRWATDDQGAAIQGAYAPYTGAPQFVSPDGRWAYLSLAAKMKSATAALTPAQRQQFTDRILSGQG